MSTVYYGGAIVTMEGENDHPEAVLVNKGIIEKVGALDEVLEAAGKNPKKVDLQGRCLMPGFIDPHGHITLNGQFSLMADLSECENFEQINDKLKKFIQDNKIQKNGVAVGTGYDHNFLAEAAHPNKYVLDQVSEEIPILILHASGHLGCANSAMLKIAGVTAETEDPQGGRFGRVEGSNEPDGYLEESAMMGSQGCLAKRLKVNIGKMLADMQKTYIENGVTTVQDGATTGQNLMLLKLANSLGKLKVDVVAYPLVTEDVKKIMGKNRKLDRKYHKHLKIGGYKMILDGSPQGRSAWMSEPYLGEEEDYCAYPWLRDEEVNKYAQMAVDDNQQLLVHCNGDAAGDQFLNAYENALKNSNNENKRNLRPVMIHCQTARSDQLDRMATMDMIASIFVGHVYYWGDIHMKNFGDKRGSRISPVKEAMDKGIVVNFHTDTPVTKPLMLHSVWAAVNRISRAGNVIGEEQKVSVYDALKAVTINGAYGYFEEDSKGSIKEGKRADLVILDKNPLEVDTNDIKDIQVLETIKDGKVIYCK